MRPVQLHALDLAIAAVLIVLDAAISITLGLRLHWRIFLSALRMVVQLLLVGFVLRIVFAFVSPTAMIAIAMLMIAAAVREAASRPAHALRGCANYRIGAAVIGLSSITTVLLALLTAIRPSPWYDPRYALPILGIVLGSVLNSASLALDTFFGAAVQRRAEIEAQLALGSTWREALAQPIRDAVRRGMIPITNQMAAAGIITLPGTMTGQILAGMDPLDASKYQILLLFLLAGAGGLAAVGAVYLASWSVTDRRHRLRVERVIQRTTDV